MRLRSLHKLALVLGTVNFLENLVMISIGSALGVGVNAVVWALIAGYFYAVIAKEVRE